MAYKVVIGESVGSVTDMDIPAVGNVLDDGFFGELDVEDVALVIVPDSPFSLRKG